MFIDETTIVALSTPMGVGGISVVRLSGKEALTIAQKSFTCNYDKQNYAEIKGIMPRQLYLGKFDAETFKEQCLMVYFKGPKSYTGEDVVEFQCHGGMVIAQGIINTLVKNGAILAQPGEFTKRAFINGKMSLDEAEGVIDMINAESESEVRAGYNLLEGTLRREVASLQDEITSMLASIEVTLDYPEVDYEEKTANEVLEKLKNLSNRLVDITETHKTGRLIKQGTRVLILGKPNVGKSSLLNAMLNYERAIVTNIQGTTRDTLEETYVYNGVKFVITDTAGLRENADEVERIGINKAKQALEQTDIVLLVLDSSEELTEEDEKIIKLVENKRTLVILNKTDLPKRINIDKYNFKNVLQISALNKEGINQLKQTIYDLVIDENIIETNLIITNTRHLIALQKAMQFVKEAINGINGKFSLDLVSIDIKNAWLALGEITGETNNEEIIDRIFADFCLGK